MVVVADETSPARVVGRPRILSLSCVYPNPISPGAGPYVRQRLQHLALHADLKVVSPLALFSYGGPAGERVRAGDARCPPQRFDGSVEVLHPRWFYFPMGGSLNALLLAAQTLGPIMRLKKRFDFEIIDAHFAYPDGIAAALLARLFGVPFTVTLRGNETHHANVALIRRCMRLAFASASRVFTVSERLRQFAIGLGADPSKAKTIPNGVETQVFHDRDRAESRKKLGLDAQRKLIISVGSLIERKGHHKVVRALSRLLGDGRSVHLAIVGGAGTEGQYEQEIHRTVSALALDGAVTFMGSVGPDAVADMMCAADVLCLPSTREGWPNVVHESLACGTPVVATDVGAVPDMLPDARYGFVVPVNDQQALERALADAIEKDWDRELIAAWGQARSWHRVGEEVFGQMQELLAERRRRLAAA